MPLSSATASLVALRQLCKAHGHWYELLHRGDGTLLHRRRQSRRSRCWPGPQGKLCSTLQTSCVSFLGKENPPQALEMISTQSPSFN